MTSDSSVLLVCLDLQITRRCCGASRPGGALSSTQATWAQVSASMSSAVPMGVCWSVWTARLQVWAHFPERCRVGAVCVLLSVAWKGPRDSLGTEVCVLLIQNYAFTWGLAFRSQPLRAALSSGLLPVVCAVVKTAVLSCPFSALRASCSDQVLATPLPLLFHWEASPPCAC